MPNVTVGNRIKHCREDELLGFHDQCLSGMLASYFMLWSYTFRC